MNRGLLVAVIAFALAQLADVLTTIEALKHAGTREANPILDWAMSLGDLWILLKLAVAGGAACLILNSRTPQWIWAITAATTFIAWQNMQVIG
ncbi:DUF5658 family protein [Pukyongiella litopenaei]|uniref:DUF5658 domain-containing protein n=1 Tax=Pukyongiella litopenaei TaxID=2605946 RepID=A0A2S0ML25_9RHOB|nr:DUF5658 family protein [Pukyongiella litopenaei]AVO36584.1 hypothetical protein C6Y53_01960 [Pukyongiella litopenaei]